MTVQKKTVGSRVEQSVSGVDGIAGGSPEPPPTHPSSQGIPSNFHDICEQGFLQTLFFKICIKVNG